MSVQQCLSCQGVYPTIQRDGSRYFHVCPPSVAPANVRNENVPSTMASDTGKLVSAGLGVQPAAVIPPGMQGLAVLS